MYEGDVITLHCQAGPCYPRNDGPLNFTQRSTLILGINNLQWESGKIQGQENSTEFAYLGLSKIVSKSSLTFTVTSLKLRQMLYLLTKWTLIPQVECGKMSPVTCTGLYSTSDKGTTLTDTFSFPGDKVLLLILKITKILSGRRENQKQFYVSYV